MLINMPYFNIEGLPIYNIFMDEWQLNKAGVIHARRRGYKLLYVNIVKL